MEGDRHQGRHLLHARPGSVDVDVLWQAVQDVGHSRTHECGVPACAMHAQAARSRVLDIIFVLRECWAGVED